jgi:triacylglycerol esterase/lipase EstA (alpha/beta hydrolase family)
MTLLALGSPASADENPASPTGSVWEIPTTAGPAQSTHADASHHVREHPGSVPPGVNNFTCIPKPAHPNPVVLLHGTDSSVYSDFAALGPRLADAGFCVFAPNFGGRPGGDSFGTEDIVDSAGQVAEFVAQVRAATGSATVDLVGYSQGATVARYFVNLLGGSTVVGQWVGLASPTYGSTLYGLVPIARQIPGAMDVAVTVLPAEFVSTALWQQAEGSPLLADLNSGPGGTGSDSVPGVVYTTIGTRVDEVIQPVSNVALKDPAATNVVVQDTCPSNQSGHFRMPYDNYTTGLVLRILDPASAPPVCTAVPLGTGVAEMLISENS